MNTKHTRGFLLTAMIIVMNTVSAFSQDTLKIMAYNVLNYGDHCQGSNAKVHAYLKTIVDYAQPDVLGLEKMLYIKRSASDPYQGSPVGFGDSILNNALNVTYPGKYAYCTLTNLSGDSKTSVLFYNQQKLGYLSTSTVSYYISDFNMHKFYYKDPNLSAHDSTFLYVILNHTQSGNAPQSDRDTQLKQISASLHAKFTHLPNLISMGDYNLHDTDLEAGYQALVADADTNFRLYDTPVFPDKILQYPIHSDSDPHSYAPYLTTSTRFSGSLPNTCGTSGGGKSWYDHMLISSWLIGNKNNMAYIPNSYHTIGNDGKRTGISINDNTSNVNTAAPAAVIEALYQFSNKYPVMLKLAVNINTTTGINDVVQQTGSIRLINPVKENLEVYFTANFKNSHAGYKIFDLYGTLVYETASDISEEKQSIVLPAMEKGVYFVRIQIENQIYQYKFIKE